MSYLYTPQCIVCEGEQDRIVLAELAARVLRMNSISQRLDIVVANGKVVIPRVVQAVEPQFPPDSVIVVADSDGRAAATRRIVGGVPWQFRPLACYREPKCRIVGHWQNGKVSPRGPTESGHTS